MAAPKTRPTGQDVTAFLDAVENPRRRAEGHALRALMERVTQQPAVMWGPTMVGFGSSPYTNTLGTNDWFDVGFSPRKPAITIYGIHNGYEPAQATSQTTRYLLSSVRTPPARRVSTSSGSTTSISTYSSVSSARPGRP